MKKKTNLTRDDWLEVALESMLEGGVDVVKVLPLSKKLKVTRGSFYWHFKDRDELLASMLDFWEREMVLTVINRVGAFVSTGGHNGKEALYELMRVITSEGLDRHDHAVRAWALYDDKAAAVLKRVDKKRLDFIKKLFLQSGFTDEQADVRCRMLTSLGAS